MKYLRYYLVDAVTGLYLHPTTHAPNGRSHPQIAGLDVVLSIMTPHLQFLAKCPDDSVILEGSGIEVLSEEDFNAAITDYFNLNKADIVKKIYDHAQKIRNAIVSAWYHSSEISFAVSVKVPQAQLALDAATDEDADLAAPYLKAEALERNVTTKELAATVIEKFNELSNQEAIVSGIRGKKSDEVLAITLDLENFQQSFNDLYAFAETIPTGWL